MVERLYKPRVLILASWLLVALASCASQHSWQTRLTADDPAERIRAVRYIADSGDVMLAPQLVTRLEDEDSAVRFYAIMGLERLTGKRCGYAYYGSYKDRAAAIRTWQQYMIEIGVSSQPTNRPTTAPDEAASQDRSVTQIHSQGEKENG